MSKKLLSIVIPAHNEEGNIATITESILDATAGLECAVEIVIVDDGSSDGTYVAACAQREIHSNIGVIKLSRNFGHQPAILSGMRACRGDAIITMDGDMQHPPQVIKQLVEKWQQGYDVVHTSRIDSATSSSLSKSLSSRGFYKLLQLLSDLKIEPGMADFRLVTRRAVSSLIHNSEHRLFFRGLSLWVGYDQATVEYLDDVLGHPISDPHGSIIPADASQIGRDREFVSSLLRKGNRASVRSVGVLAETFGFKPGDIITMGERADNGKTWTLIAEDGRELQLDHEQADSLIVRMVK